jgi:glycosyltransferase involved in cell wall biosynthesis
MPHKLPASTSSEASAISVVVPVYNGAATIEACVRSLLLSEDPGELFEIIVVDNASSDHTMGILAGYRDRIRVLQERVRGASAARNTGIRNARGKIIAFTDADCIVEPRWLREIVPPLRDREVGIAGGPILSTLPCNRIEMFGERIHDHRRSIEDSSPSAITMNWASRREVLEDVGLFDESLLRGHDADLARRIRMRGYRLIYCPQAVVHHRNESTLRGLFLEGVAHGRAVVMMRDKYPFASPADTFHPKALHRRMKLNLRRCLSGTNRFEALCEVVFDAGKALGVRIYSCVAPRTNYKRLGNQRPENISSRD